MSSIHPYTTDTGAKRYRVAYRRPDGRWTSKRGFARKIDAQAWLEHQAVAMRSGEWIDPKRGKVTIRELGPSWLERKAHRAHSTQVALETSWRVHVEPRWGATAAADVRHTDVQAWVSGMEGSATKVKRALGVLSGILQDAARDRLIAANPCAGVQTPAPHRQPHRYLTAAEVHRLAATSKYPVLIYTLSYLGLRWGEAAALRVRDYSPAWRRLHVAASASRIGGQMVVGPTKGRQTRTLTVPTFLADMLTKHVAGRDPADLIFPGPDGGHMQIQAHNRSWFQAALRRAGLERMTPHDLRHTAASLAVSSGANVKAVQRMLGHKSAAMTLDRYSGLFDSDLDALASALDRTFAGSLSAASE